MNYNRIKSLQKEYGYDEMQAMIDNGSVWRLEGSMGRSAMGCLESGACMLPKQVHSDYYGNRIPARHELKEGTKGTYQNAKEFWEQVENGEIFLSYEKENII